MGVNAKPTGSSMICLSAGTGIGPEDEHSAIDGSVSNQSSEFYKTEPDAAMSEREDQLCTADEEPGASMLERRVSQDDFRVRFLSKLSYNKVWLPPVQKPPKSQAVLIFDWDDTLICTTWLRSYSSREALPSVLDSVFAQIAREA